MKAKIIYENYQEGIDELGIKIEYKGKVYCGMLSQELKPIVNLNQQIKEIIQSYDKERGISKEKIWEILLTSNKNESIDKHDFLEKLQQLFDEGEIYESAIDRIRYLE